MDEKRIRVESCAHCGNTAPQHEHGLVVDDRDDRFPVAYVLARCATCSSGNLFVAEDGIYFDNPQNTFELVWPAPPGLHWSVPDRIREIYREAAKIKRFAPNAFATQIRRAVEAVCKDQGEVKGSLADRIKSLAQRGVIPGALADMTDFLRKLGNAGSHDDEEEDVHPKYVEPIDDFFRAVIEYVYIAPWRLAEFKEQLDAAKKT